MTLPRYVRRSTPPFDAGWFDAEHIAIQRALSATEDAVDALGSAGGTAQRVSNATNNTASFASAGLVVPVVAGQSYRIHYALFISNNFAGSGRLGLSVSYPSTSTILAGVLGLTTAAAVSLQSFIGSGTPMSLGTTWLQFSTATPIAFSVDLVLRNVTSNGNVDLMFAADGSGNTVTLGDGSCAIATVL